MNYYEKQLSLLKIEDYPASIIVFDGNGETTKQMDLNETSIPVLIEFLTKLLTKEGK